MITIKHKNKVSSVFLQCGTIIQQPNSSLCGTIVKKLLAKLCESQWHDCSTAIGIIVQQLLAKLCNSHWN